EDLLLCEVDLESAAAARLTNPRHRSPADTPAQDADDDGAELLATIAAPPAPASALAGPSPALRPLLEPLEAEVYAALCLGLHDYVEKNRFEHVVFGLSGGIDSALVACIAVDALGDERVSTAIMPSQYS